MAQKDIQNPLREAPVSTSRDIRSILKAGASLKVTVVCLLLLAILTVWGTLYQADHGLYQAQQKFFHSWAFFLFGFIPFPGTVLVMFVLFFNLVLSLLYRIPMRLRNLGNIITHTGIIVLLVGGFFTFYYSQESSLMLREGETGTMSSSRYQWELAVWETPAAQGGETDVYAVDTAGFKAGGTVGFAGLGITLRISAYYANCRAFSSGRVSSDAVLNSSGIRNLEEAPASSEVGENIAGALFRVEAPVLQGPPLLLYGQDTVPTTVKTADRSFTFSLRRRKIPLPVAITLTDFTVEMYPNSTIPKNYQSRVKLNTAGGVEREVVISMNKPLRFADLTFFQSSYYIDKAGNEFTILAVVKNAGRLLPYFSSIIIFLGMAIHFLVMLLRRKNVTTRENPSEPKE